MQGNYTYIPETNDVPREYSVAAILLLLILVLISLVSVLNLLYFYISTFRSMCAVPNYYYYGIVYHQNISIMVLDIFTVTMPKAFFLLNFYSDLKLVLTARFHVCFVLSFVLSRLCLLSPCIVLSL